MGPKRYATAAAFRRALEDRLQDIAGKESVDLQRLRRQVAFDRLLARLFQAAQPRALPWVLKGGYAMELRIKAARTTKDIDLTMRSVFSSDEKKDDKQNLAVGRFQMFYEILVAIDYRTAAWRAGAHFTGLPEIRW